jgi:hypothetical protein
MRHLRTSTALLRSGFIVCFASPMARTREPFADIVEKGFLPKERAEICSEEYSQIDFAFRTLIAPHMNENP